MAMSPAADLTVNIGADTSGLDAGLAKADGSIKSTGKNFGAAAGIMGMASGAIAGGFLFAANSAMDFEGAMADVDASLTPTTAQLQSLRQEALAIGRDTTFSATQGAQAIEELGRAGVSIQDIMGGAAMSTAQLASATGEDLANSANVMANSMTIFGIAGSESAAVADTMTAALNESSLTLTDFAQGMASAGTMANAVGMSFEQTSGALALFSANGLSGADAGTALRSMLTHMANPTAEAAELFTQLGFSMQEGIESGDLMGYTAGKLQEGLGHLSESERMAALTTMFGADAQRVANILFSEGAEGVAEMTDKMRSNGQAQEAARRRMGGLRGAMESLSGSFETAMIVIGSGLTPMLTGLAEAVGDAVNWFTNLPEPLIRLVSIVAGVVGALLGLGAAFASVMAVGGLIPGGFGAIAAAMGSVLGPIALLVAAGIALYYAYQNNFMGIQDIVTSAMSAISEVFGAFGDIIGGLATGNVAQFFDGMNALPAALRPVGELLAVVTTEAMALYDAFASGGLSGLMDALPGSLGRVGAAFADLGQSILEGIGNIDWGSLFSNLGDAASAIGSWMLEQLGRVPWAELWASGLSALASAGSWVAGKLGEAITAIGTWISEQVGGVNWQGAFEGAMSVLSAVGTWLAGKLGDAATAIGTWISEQVGKVNWQGAFETGMSGLSAAGAWVASALGDIWDTLTEWVTGQIESVDWASLIPSIGENISNTISLAISGMADIFTTVLSWITRQIEGVNWVSVGSKFGELLATGIKGIVGLAGVSVWLLGQVLLALVEVDWGAVAKTFGTFLSVAINALVGFMAGFASTLFNELTSELANVNWASLGTQITEAFKSAVVGVGTAIGQAIWAELPGWLKTLIEGGAGALGIGQGPTTNSAGGSFGSYEPNPNGTGTDAYGQQRGWRTEYSDPYNPTQGGKGIVENNEGLFLPMATAARDYSAALDAVALSQTSVADGAIPLSTNMSTVSTSLTSLGPGFVTLSGELTTTQTSFVTFVTAAMSVMGGFAIGIPALVSAAMAGFHPPISQGTSDGKQSFMAFVTAAMSVMGGFAAGVPAIVSSTMSSFRSTISSGTSTGKQSFITFVADTIAVLGGWASGVTTNASSTMSSFRSTISSGTSTGKQSFITFVADTIAVMGGWSSGMRTNVSSTMSSMVSSVSAGMSNIRSAISSGMSSATSAVRAESSQWAGIIGNAAGAMHAAGQRAGAAAGQGLVSGLSSMRGAVAAEAASLANAAAAAIDNALAIHSPSGVTRRSGRNTGLGFGLGLLDMAGYVEHAASDVAMGASAAFVGEPGGGPRTYGQSSTAQQIVYNDQRSFVVKVDDLPELQKAADFMNDLQRDRESMYGGN